MYIDEVPESIRTEHRQECPTCTMETLVLSKKDDFAEYYTEIYVMCGCGEYLEFILPMN